MEDQIDPRWRKSSYSGNGGGDCVEIGSAAGQGPIMVRDTKQAGTGPVLAVSTAAWRRLTNELKAC